MHCGDSRRRLPVSRPPVCIGKGGEKGFLQLFLPNLLPEPLDSAKCHRMPGGTSEVANTLALENLLEPCLATPGNKPATVVGQDLPGRAPRSHRSLDHFQDLHGSVKRNDAPLGSVFYCSCSYLIHLVHKARSGGDISHISIF